MAGEASSYQNVSFPIDAGGEREAHGYLALPESGSGPGLVVVQEWWGLTSHIAAMTDRFAGEGFVALAPDLFGGKTTHDAEEAGSLMEQLPVDSAARDLSGSVDFLLGREDVTGEAVGAVGFCMGGGFVLTLAAQEGARVAAAVPFYGVVKDMPDFSGLRASVQGHFGDKDDFVPPDAAREVAAKIEQESGRSPEMHFYPAGHAFMNDENLLGTYDPDQARVAWDRTIRFLHDKLG